MQSEPVRDEPRAAARRPVVRARARHRAQEPQRLGRARAARAGHQLTEEDLRAGVVGSDRGSPLQKQVAIDPGSSARGHEEALPVGLVPDRPAIDAPVESRGRSTGKAPEGTGVRAREADLPVAGGPRRCRTGQRDLELEALVARVGVQPLERGEVPVDRGRLGRGLRLVGRHRVGPAEVHPHPRGSERSDAVERQRGVAVITLQQDRVVLHRQLQPTGSVSRPSAEQAEEKTEGEQPPHHKRKKRPSRVELR